MDDRNENPLLNLQEIEEKLKTVIIFTALLRI